MVSELVNLPKNLPSFIIANDGILVMPQYPIVYLFTSISHLYHTIPLGVEDRREVKSRFLQAVHHGAVK